MFKNYIKVAVRTLLKNKLFSAINIFGLALSMSICLLVLLRLKDQLGYDTFHPNPERTYRITTEWTNKEGNALQFATAPLPLLNTFAKDYNLVEHATRLYMPGPHEVSLGKKKLEVKKMFADADFFSVFGFALKEGNSRTALEQPNSIVLTNEMAGRFFGKETAIGKNLSFKNWGDFKVTGIMNEPMGKSHIEFDALVSINSVPLLEKTGKLPVMLDKWNSFNNSYTYLTVKKGVSAKQLRKAIDSFSATLMKASSITGKEKLIFKVQALPDIILGEEMQSQLGNTGSKGKTWAEIAIAFVILLSACFNYTNLSIARSFNRGKEIGVRKVSGAFRFHIFWQFIIESLLVCLLSLAMAYVLLQLIIDHAPFSQEMIPDNFSFDISLFGWFLVFAFFTSLLAGALPAWALSSFKPVHVLKNLASIKLFGGNAFRKGLIITQFVLSLVIIIFSQTFSRQFNYMEAADPGYSRDDRISIPVNAEDVSILSTEMGRISAVEKVTASSGQLGRDATGYTQVKKQPGDQALSIAHYDIDTGFITGMQLKLLAGNNFSRMSNASGEQYVIINEKAAEILKFKTAAESIGQQIWLDDSIQASVAGVVNDFYFRGVDEAIQPLLLRGRSQNFHLLTIKMRSQAKEAVNAIEKVWKKYNPDQAFTYSWLQESKSAWETVSMLGFLAFIAVTLACLGLLGMVTYNIERRRKEISIRKIMGANTTIIVSMLSKGFLKLVLIAGCIALPISYILGYLFLNIFANRIQLGVATQLISLAGLFLIALLTMVTQIYKVAIANPAASLRTE